MKLKPCKCGRSMQITASMCAVCRKKHRITDDQMFKAIEVQLWLSKPWTSIGKRQKTATT